MYSSRYLITSSFACVDLQHQHWIFQNVTSGLWQWPGISGLYVNAKKLSHYTWTRTKAGILLFPIVLIPPLTLWQITKPGRRVWKKNMIFTKEFISLILRFHLGRHRIPSKIVTWNIHFILKLVPTTLTNVYKFIMYQTNFLLGGNEGSQFLVIKYAFSYFPETLFSLFSYIFSLSTKNWRKQHSSRALSFKWVF